MPLQQTLASPQTRKMLIDVSLVSWIMNLVWKSSAAMTRLHVGAVIAIDLLKMWLGRSLTSTHAGVVLPRLPNVDRTVQDLELFGFLGRCCFCDCLNCCSVFTTKSPHEYKLKDVCVCKERICSHISL